MRANIFSALVVASLGCFTTTTHAWSLSTSHSGSSFLDGFNFFTGADPTHGFVEYVSAESAGTLGLTQVRNGQVIVKADNRTASSPSGRNSVRISSKAAYTGGLFILDLAHMPFGCGTWPAFWMVGPNWPFDGEIDILEGVNNQATNQATLHTTTGCSFAGIKRNQTGTVNTDNCDINAPGQSSNAGCGTQFSKSTSYGSGFNKIGGGVYAIQWTSNGGVQVWFFPRSSIPADITGGHPGPNTWPAPDASFPFGSFCPDRLFADMSIVFDLTFCGDWAGNTYASSGCPSTCNLYVQNTPSAFDEAYWAINSLKIYQQ